MFPICAKGDDQKLESQTWQEPVEDAQLSYHKHSYRRRDAYATFRSASGTPEARHVAEPIVS